MPRKEKLLVLGKDQLTMKVGILQERSIVCQKKATNRGDCLEALEQTEEKADTMVLGVKTDQSLPVVISTNVASVQGGMSAGMITRYPMQDLA
jgi:hypothetical protein